MSDAAAVHLGDFVAITHTPDRVIQWRRPNRKHVGYHGGATPSEVLVPLVVVSSGGVRGAGGEGAAAASDGAAAISRL